jgi:hypothetical protein
MNQLSHRCSNDTHLALTSLLQPLSPALKEGATPQRRDGWKVERTPQPSITDL